MSVLLNLFHKVCALFCSVGLPLETDSIQCTVQLWFICIFGCPIVCKLTCVGVADVDNNVQHYSSKLFAVPPPPSSLLSMRPTKSHKEENVQWDLSLESGSTHSGGYNPT